MRFSGLRQMQKFWWMCRWFYNDNHVSSDFSICNMRWLLSAHFHRTNNGGYVLQHRHLLHNKDIFFQQYIFFAHQISLILTVSLSPTLIYMINQTHMTSIVGLKPSFRTRRCPMFLNKHILNLIKMSIRGFLLLKHIQSFYFPLPQQHPHKEGKWILWTAEIYPPFFYWREGEERKRLDIPLRRGKAFSSVQTPRATLLFPPKPNRTSLLRFKASAHFFVPSVSVHCSTANTCLSTLDRPTPPTVTPCLKLWTSDRSMTSSLRRKAA